ncbi:MAG: TonB-dependent receptor plug domain-containing protein [Bacteroidales bacterium]|nr:TonB-dependent receptor plug domain-containing protein [Bacteroidales bacterium]
MKKALLFIAACILLCGAAGAQEKVRNPKDKTQYNSVFDLLRDEPGVTVSPGGGNGEMPRILIRGVATNSDQTQPLFVVDGIITDNVTYLRPEDIYSVEVLKDGTASIYGVQGQNGVIMFRTKSMVEAEQRAAEQAKAERKAAREARRNSRRK